MASSDKLNTPIEPSIANYDEVYSEVLYEDEQFSERQLAALVASKVYYHLGEYDESMIFALGAGELFDITAKSEYVETIICSYTLMLGSLQANLLNNSRWRKRPAKCIDKYILINSHNDSILSSPPTLLSSLVDDASFPTTNPAKKETLETVDPRLQDIVERMFRKCYETEDYKPAIGIAIEARRLDVVEEGIKLASQRSRERKGKVKEVEDEKDGGVELMDYVLDITMGVVQEIGLREKVCFPVPKFYR